MKKNIFYALMMPALLLGTVSCTDYQDDIDKLTAENDALRSYNNQTISQLNSVVFQTENGLNCITVDQPNALRGRAQGTGYDNGCRHQQTELCQSARCCHGHHRCYCRCL